MEKEITGAEIEKIVSFIQQKQCELDNKGHHPDEIALLVPYWLYNAIQRYYHVFFKGELPERFFGVKANFHYKNEVVVYNWMYPENAFFSIDVIVKVSEKTTNLYR